MALGLVVYVLLAMAGAVLLVLLYAGAHAGLRRIGLYPRADGSYRRFWRERS